MDGHQHDGKIRETALILLVVDGRKSKTKSEAKVNKIKVTISQDDHSVDGRMTIIISVSFAFLNGSDFDFSSV